jgi:23S rRNA G2069 N7-methylase RlmK/C1962 C5-methylase RlmI
MRTVAECNVLAKGCHELAAMLTDPKDKLATELMASRWEKAAKKRKAQLKQQPVAAFRSIAAALF